MSLFLLLCVKSLVLDPYTPQDAFEKKLAEEAVEGLETKGMLHWRVVDIDDLREPKEGLEYQKVIKLRRYLLYILPIRNGYVYR